MTLDILKMYTPLCNNPQTLVYHISSYLFLQTLLLPVTCPSCPLQPGLLPFPSTKLLHFPQKPSLYKLMFILKFISPSCLSSCSSFKTQLKHHLLLELLLSLPTLLGRVIVKWCWVYTSITTFSLLCFISMLPSR